MTLPLNLVNDIVTAELKQCESLVIPNYLEISTYDTKTQTFTVNLTSKIDDEKFILEVECENYNEWPPFLEFIDPVTREREILNAYPKCDDSFFNKMKSIGCICNPCSRKSYKGYSGPHKDDTSWVLTGWKSNPKVSSLTTLPAIITAIYHRINDKSKYEGRMKP
ncbi:MAG: hypothetical protein IIC67_04365 [Thaumarchaeota archaeon]|nr:hypothetical protein [Nitrososphaerota archaeon]